MGEGLLIDLLKSCNIDCSFCYNTIEGVLDPDTVLSFVKEYFGEQVSLGGGEPALYESFNYLVTEILKMDKKVRFSTNGTILMEDLIESHSGNENISLQVSIPAFDNDIYHQITGKDFVDKVKDNVEVYKNHFRTALNMVVVDKSVDQIEPVLNYAKEQDLFLYISPPVGTKGKQHLSIENAARAKNIILGKEFSGYELFSAFVELKNNCPLLEPIGMQQTHECPIKKEIYIAPDGSKHNCQYIANREG